MKNKTPSSRKYIRKPPWNDNLIKCSYKKKERKNKPNIPIEEERYKKINSINVKTGIQI